MQEIKPCPFCGNPKVKLAKETHECTSSDGRHIKYVKYSVRCGFCYARGGLPCGLCRLTNAMCLFVSLQPDYISCNDTVYINEFGQTIICSSEADNHVEGTN